MTNEMAFGFRLMSTMKIHKFFFRFTSSQNKILRKRAKSEILSKREKTKYYEKEQHRNIKKTKEWKSEAQRREHQWIRKLFRWKSKIINKKLRKLIFDLYVITSSCVLISHTHTSHPLDSPLTCVLIFIAWDRQRVIWICLWYQI